MVKLHDDGKSDYHPGGMCKHSGGIGDDIYTVFTVVTEACRNGNHAN